MSPCHHVNPTFRPCAHLTVIAHPPTNAQLISRTIKACKAKGKYVGICGQGPSDYPDFAQYLVEQGIESMSLTPDSLIPTLVMVAKVEADIDAAAKTQ